MSEPTLGVVGVGSIGGSVALAAKRAGYRVVGYDRDPAVLERALALRVLDEASSRAQLYARARVVVIAPHLEATIEEVRALGRGPRPNARLIVDVGSVKLPVVQAARGLADFVATHPMAGTERHGPDAAREDLFDGRSWAYVRSGDGALEDRARAFIAQMGAVPFAIDAQTHDRVVALTSHLPQLLASLFARRLRELEAAEGAQLDALCGPTARELLRLSASGYPMWRDIFAHNAPALEREVRELSGALALALQALATDDADALVWP